jgi:hypothetical protein
MDLRSKRTPYTTFLFITFLIPCALSEERSDPPLNLLFFGNSLTGVNDVPTLVSDVADAAGQTPPVVFAQILNGKTLSDHLSHSGTNVIIQNALPPEETWDFTVLQEQSYKPSAAGQPMAFRNDAVALFDKVRAHSPEVFGVLFENWPRDEGGWPYGTYFYFEKADMLADIRNATTLAREDIFEHVGNPQAGVAPIGSAWENNGWNNLHLPDRVHATPRGSLLAALVIYGRIYLDDTSDIPASQAASILAKLNLTEAEWSELTLSADSADELPSPHHHLFALGEKIPGTKVKMVFTGPVGASPVGLWLSAGLIDPPMTSSFGPWHLLLPAAGPILLSPIPDDNTLAFKANLPSSPPGPWTVYMQALIGELFTNPYALDVK